MSVDGLLILALCAFVLIIAGSAYLKKRRGR
jgi:hypothetical protein